MAMRKPLGTARADEPSSKGSYFTEDKPLEFISSGSTLLDCVLGGGWVLGRIGNLVGDRSSGKTLLAIEASANFVKTYPTGLVRYCEAEAAFDKLYAAELGLPVESVEFAEGILTVEELFEDLERCLDTLKGRPCLYIVDSLDALSDKAEQERSINDGSYGAAKAKKLGELFRRLVKKMEQSRLCLIVISQIRDKIGVTFGETKMRSGGHALDFYASQVVWLADTGKLKKTAATIERVIGINVLAKNKKNKIGLPFRDCEFPILFGYGTDDVISMVEWLMKTKGEAVLDQFDVPNLNKSRYKSTLAKLRDEGGPVMRDLRIKMQKVTVQAWRDIENSFLPKSKKY